MDLHMSQYERKSVFGVSHQVTNRPIHPKKKATIMKFWVSGEEEPYYPCSENKGTDQLCNYCTADLRLCFRIGKNPVFS